MVLTYKLSHSIIIPVNKLLSLRFIYKEATKKIKNIFIKVIDRY